QRVEDPVLGRDGAHGEHISCHLFDVKRAGHPDGRGRITGRLWLEAARDGSPCAATRDGLRGIAGPLRLETARAGASVRCGWRRRHHGAVRPGGTRQPGLPRRMVRLHRQRTTNVAFRFPWPVFVIATNRYVPAGTSTPSSPPTVSGHSIVSSAPGWRAQSVSPNPARVS